jgi:hypothetical protein
MVDVFVSFKQATPDLRGMSIDQVREEINILFDKLKMVELERSVIFKNPFLEYRQRPTIDRSGQRQMYVLEADGYFVPKILEEEE